MRRFLYRMANGLTFTRQRLRTLKKNGFKDLPHENTGRAALVSVLDGYTGIIDDLLCQGVDNSVVCFERVQAYGYTGSLSTVKRYIVKHKDLIPAKRQLVAPQGSRGTRYQTGPGEAYQMDWDFTAFCGPQRSLMRFSAVAVRSITAAGKRTVTKG